MDCSVCTGRFTVKTRQQVVCKYCNEVACRQCYTNYLLTKSNPQCMHCNQIWDKDFCLQLFGKQFTVTLEKHMLESLFQIEKSLIPYTISKIDREKRITKYRLLTKEVEKLARQLEDLEDELRRHQFSKSIHECIIGTITDSETISTLYSTLRQTEVNRLPEITPSDIRAFHERACHREPSIRHHNKIISNLDYKIFELTNKVEEQQKNYSSRLLQLDEYDDIKSEVHVLSVPCSKVNCKGFCDKNNICVLCQTKTCPDCREVVLAFHDCDKDLVRTIKLLEKQSKPCPGCKIRISKVDGCNQMFCTNCNTAFNWEKGTIDNGRIHNPHYFDWLKKNGGTDTRQAQARGGDCDDPTAISSKLYVLRSSIKNRESLKQIDGCVSMIQLYNHIHDLLRSQANQIILDPKERFDGIRKWVIVDNPDETKWKTELYKQSRKVELMMKTNLLLQMCNDVNLDILRKLQLKLVDAPKITWMADIDIAYKELHSLIEYFNEQSKQISSYYGYMQRYEIDENYALRNNAYNSSETTIKVDNIETCIMNPPVDCNKIEMEVFKLIRESRQQYKSDPTSLVSFLSSSYSQVLDKIKSSIKKCKTGNKRIQLIIKAQEMMDCELFAYMLNKEPLRIVRCRVGDYTMVAPIIWWLGLFYHKFEHLGKTMWRSAKVMQCLQHGNDYDVFITHHEGEYAGKTFYVYKGSDALAYSLVVDKSLDNYLSFVQFFNYVDMCLFNGCDVPKPICKTVKAIAKGFDTTTTKNKQLEKIVRICERYC